MKARKNGDEGQNDAQVLKTYCSDTMTRNMGCKKISSIFQIGYTHSLYRRLQEKKYEIRDIIRN